MDELISSNLLGGNTRVDGRKLNRPTRVEPGSREIRDRRKKNLTPAQMHSEKLCEMYHQRLRENVRLLRGSLGYSQSKLAELCGWARTTVVRLETGERHPSYGQVCVLARILKVSVGVLEKDLSWIFEASNGGALTEVLRRRRLAENLTQQEAAERCGMSRSQYCEIESGKTEPSAKQLLALSQGFGDNLIFAA